MARQETDREDLLAEATALVERIELHLDGHQEPVVIGFRRDGCGSIYFGGDPAYHFNARNELRRAYIGGLLYKAERGRLIALERRRTAAEVRLERHELSEAETHGVLEEFSRRLFGLSASLESQGFHVTGQVPAGSDVVGRATSWLKALRESPIVIAATPRVG